MLSFYRCSFFEKEKVEKDFFTVTQQEITMDEILDNDKISFLILKTLV